MLNRRRFLSLLALLPWGFPTAVLAARQLVTLRQSVNEQRNRIVFEFDGKVEIERKFAIKNPPRYVLDIKRARISKSVPKSPRFDRNGIVKGLRSNVSKDGTLRLVLDLKRLVPAEVSKWLTTDGKKDRIVVDFLGSFVVPKQTRKPSTPERKPSDRAPTPSISSRSRRLVVAIDPGHGGKDPGAVGKGKTREKDVVLSISKKLYKLFKADPRITPYLTRNRDVFLRLHQRTRIARNKKADLFVSVHADAARRRSARGASVYALSTRGSSSAHARWLADRENAADLKGGIEISGRDPDVQKVLLSMSQNAVQEYSLNAGELMVNSLKRVGKMHSQRVERAGFAVLKSPDIPSILVETGFISNVHEEKLLRTKNHQRRVALALRSGIRNYFNKMPEYS
ncbi:MAG: N-acetylmuramoyl-L-alanine amidase [Gammaproteobacteria bacterium]|nr:N-acetylmuramoyl-L-alanine amidase [Gammaproteobacteria bacterium]